MNVARYSWWPSKLMNAPKARGRLFVCDVLFLCFNAALWFPLADPANKLISERLIRAPLYAFIGSLILRFLFWVMFRTLQNWLKIVDSSINASHWAIQSMSVTLTCLLHLKSIPLPGLPFLRYLHHYSGLLIITYSPHYKVSILWTRCLSGRRLVGIAPVQSSVRASCQPWRHLCWPTLRTIIGKGTVTSQIQWCAYIEATFQCIDTAEMLI